MTPVVMAHNVLLLQACMFDPCAVLNGGCAELCARDLSGGVQCACAGSRRLAPDGRACEPGPAAAGAACPRDHFHCAEGPCLPEELVCDGVRHCSDAEDASDEDYAYCSEYTSLLCRNLPGCRLCDSS